MKKLYNSAARVPASFNEEHQNEEATLTLIYESAVNYGEMFAEIIDADGRKFGGLLKDVIPNIDPNFLVRIRPAWNTAHPDARAVQTSISRCGLEGGFLTEFGHMCTAEQNP